MRFCQTSLDTVTNSDCPAESRYGGAVDVQRAVDLYSQGCLARWLGDPLEHVRQKVLDVLVGDRVTTVGMPRWTRKGLKFQAHVKYED